MKKLKDAFYAEAFGGDFPVCNEDQAKKLEIAYLEATKYEVEHPEEQVSAGDDRCTCDLIIGLLNGTLNRTELISAGFFVAREIYTKKLAVESVARLMEKVAGDGLDMVLQTPGGKETVH